MAHRLRAARRVRVAASRLISREEDTYRPAAAWEEPSDLRNAEQAPGLRAESHSPDVDPLVREREALEVRGLACERGPGKHVEVEVARVGVPEQLDHRR